MEQVKKTRGPGTSVKKTRTRVSIDFPTPEAAFDWLEEQKDFGLWDHDVGYVLSDAIHEEGAAYRNEFLVRRHGRGNGREIVRGLYAAYSIIENREEV